MIKVKIFKADNLEVQTHGATFPTQAEADSWLAQGAQGKWWGEPEWTEVIPAVTEEIQTLIAEAILDDQGNVVVPAQYSTNVSIIEPEQTVVHPAEYTVVIQDITAQLNQEKEIAKNLSRMDFGRRLMAELAASNQADLISGALTVPQIIEAEASLAYVQRLISNGSLSLAVQVLSGLEVPHLSIEKKTLFITKMQEYLSNEL